MLLPDWAVLNAAIDWLGHGLWNLTWWQIVLYTLVTTHITIAAVTIFLHRAQAHRALDLHAIPAHFFRFWLWIGTGMDQGMGGHSPQAPRQVRNRGRPTQPADPAWIP
jgi:stearoyl-CoA desaturase (delta-9 desaturase)